MKKLILLTVITLVSFAVAACGGAATNAPNTANAGNTTAENSTENKANDTKPTTSGLSPDSVTPDKPIPAADLPAAVKANQAAWKGKEVSVVGKVLDPQVTTDAKSGKKTYALRIAEPNSFSIVAICSGVEKEPPADYKTNPEDRVIKGTIEEMSSIGDMVKLKNCDYVK